MKKHKYILTLVSFFIVILVVLSSCGHLQEPRTTEEVNETLLEEAREEAADAILGNTENIDAADIDVGLQ